MRYINIIITALSITMLPNIIMASEEELLDSCPVLQQNTTPEQLDWFDKCVSNGGAPLSAFPSDVDLVYKPLARFLHPDKGHPGCQTAMVCLNNARDLKKKPGAATHNPNEAHSNKDKYTESDKALNIAILKNDEARVQELLTAGSDPNSPICEYSVNWGWESCPETERPPLLNAILVGNPHLLELLVSSGADVNLVDVDMGSWLPSTNRSFLHHFAGWNQKKAPLISLQELVRLGVNVNLQDLYGETPLMIAIDHGTDYLAEFLVNNHADLEIKDPGERTALWHTFQFSLISVPMIKLLIRHGADVNTVAKGKTPLDAIEQKKLECSKKPDQWDCKNNHQALEDIERLLKQNGAKHATEL